MLRRTRDFEMVDHRVPTRVVSYAERLVALIRFQIILQFDFRQFCFGCDLLRTCSFFSAFKSPKEDTICFLSTI